ncbi:MAG: glutathione S-transferase 2 [Hyphomicrobiales bacterium]|nr:glutathione S-transferase 2 [Hyphomicrobiales bacterium]
MLVLYHGDTSVCSVKVRLALAEKELAWTSRLIDLQRGEQHAPEYTRLNPAHVVPTLVDNDHAIVESSIILEYLEGRFPDRALMPPDPKPRSVVRIWLRRIDDLHASCSTLSSAVKLQAVRERSSVRDIAAYLLSIRDEAKRSRQRRLIDVGFDAPDVLYALREFERISADMEAALSKHPFLAGHACTLADLAALPYLNRAEMLGMKGLWHSVRPRLAVWIEQMRARPSYAEAILRWAPEGLGRYKASPELERLLEVAAREPSRNEMR